VVDIVANSVDFVANTVDFVANTVDFVANTVDFVASVYRALNRHLAISITEISTCQDVVTHGKIKCCGW